MFNAIVSLLSGLLLPSLLALSPLFFGISAQAAFSWSSEEVRLYNQRNFITLEHLMIEAHQTSRVPAMRKQEADLSGCRALNHGAGGIASTIQCMSFLNREKSLGLRSKGAAGLAEDINILCGKLAANGGALEKMLGAEVLVREPRLWRSCSRSFWKQLYLTTYANFDADPVRTLVLVRKAEMAFPKEEPWLTKVESLIRKN